MLPAVDDLVERPASGAGLKGQRLALVDREVEVVLFESVHAETIPAGTAKVNTHRSFTYRYDSATIHVMEKYERLQALLTFIKNRYCGGKAAELARRIGKADSYVNRLFYPQEKNGAKGIGAEIMEACSEAFDLPRGFWEMTPEEAVVELSGVPDPGQGPIAAAGPGTPDTGTLDVYYAKGSCGGGSLTTEQSGEVREQLVKEASWFKKYDIRPGEALTIYADGNSMADFIVDGDIVIFKKGVSELVSGNIYVIDTPDGLRIKRVHKRSDGTIVLSSDNGNKRKYPDEEYPSERAAALQFKGSFVYRQGG